MLPWPLSALKVSKPVQVAGFGAIAIDELIYVDRPLHAQKGRVTSCITAHGGNVATALVAVTTLGARASFIGWVSQEQAFEASLNDLSTHGVETAYAPRIPQAAPIKSIITVGIDGERFIAFDDNVPIGTATDLTIKRLAGASVLLLDSYATRALPAVRAVKAMGLPIVADIEWSVGVETDELLALCNHLVLPWQAAEALTGKAEAGEIIASLWSEDRAAVVLTKGGEGAFVRQAGDDCIGHQLAHDVEVVDTTGAGDCFHGAYCFGLVTGMTPKESVRFANAAAALSITRQGGREGLPKESSVLALLESAPEFTPL